MTKRLGGLFKEIARFLEGRCGSRCLSLVGCAYIAGPSRFSRRQKIAVRFAGGLQKVAKALILTCALALPAVPTSAQHLDTATDLARSARDGAAAGRAVLVLFSEKDCVWCERTRREFLLPMQRNAGYREKLVFLQVNVDSDAKLTDFQGKPTTHAAVSRQHRIKQMPTVMLFGAGGESLAEPLVGFTGSDYYGYYLDQRVDTAVAKIRAR